jgi:hypothetical protein
VNKEKLQHHLKHLKERHAELEKKIKDGYSHYLDDMHLGKIKHEKLSVKRDIESAEKKLNTFNVEN